MIRYQKGGVLYKKDGSIQKFQSGSKAPEVPKRNLGASPSMQPDSPGVYEGPGRGYPTRTEQFKRDMNNMFRGNYAPWNFAEANRLKHRLYGSEAIAKQSREAFSTGTEVKPPRNRGGFDRSDYPPNTPTINANNEEAKRMGSFFDAIRYEGLEGPSLEGSLGYPMSKIPEELRREMISTYDPLHQSGMSIEGPADDPTMNRDKLFGIMTKKYPELQGLYDNFSTQYNKRFKKGGLLYKKYQKGGKDTLYAPLNTSSSEFGHMDTKDPGVYYMRGDNYENVHGTNAALKGMVNTSTGALKRGEVDAWHQAYKNYGDSQVMAEDGTGFVNDEQVKLDSFKDFRSQYGDKSLMDDSHYQQNFSQVANQKFMDNPNLSQINYGHSDYTKPESTIDTLVDGTPSFNTANSGGGIYGVDSYQYNRPSVSSAEAKGLSYSDIPAKPPVKPEMTIPGAAPSGPKPSFGSTNPNLKSSFRHIDAMRSKRKKGGLLY